MAEAKKLVIFVDSIAKGVMFQDGRYHLCRGHDFDALAQQGVEVRNYAKMGACTDTGLAIAKKRLESCRDAQVLLFFGGNDCDFDWQAVSDHPDGVHLPKIPAEQFLENYRALMDLVANGKPGLAFLACAAGGAPVFGPCVAGTQPGKYSDMARRYGPHFSLAGVL